MYYIVFCLVVNILTFVYGDCPDGFLSHKESCYKEFGIKATWAEAYMICKAYGGYLANIDTASEQIYVASYLSRLAKDSFKPGKFWLGGTDLQTEGVWVWTRSADVFQYKNWKQGQPDNYHGNENCVSFDFDSNFKWDDNNCQLMLNFMCEIG